VSVKRGRPLIEFKQEYCDDLLIHMAEGYSFESFVAHLFRKYGKEARLSRFTLYTWLDKHPDFSDARRQGDELARMWWEETAKKGVRGQLMRVEAEVYDKDGKVQKRKFASAVFGQSAWAITMRNRFGYKDKVEVSGSVDTSPSIDKILKLASLDPKVLEGLRALAEVAGSGDEESEE
jgi:hypothetical protein